MLLLAAVLLLCSCAARYDYQNGIALRLKEIKGDKYSAEVWVEVAFEDRSRPMRIEADRLGTSFPFPEHKTQQSLIPMVDGPENVGLIKHEIHDIKSINNQEYNFVAENISAEDKTYSGRWELPFTIKNDETSVYYTAVPKAEDKNQITFTVIEVCPYTLHFEATQPASMYKEQGDAEREVLFSNGEKRKGSGSSEHREVNESTLNSTVNIRFGSEVDAGAVSGLMIDGVEYILTKV